VLWPAEIKTYLDHLDAALEAEEKARKAQRKKR
jgi:hypothetical protein